MVEVGDNEDKARISLGQQVEAASVYIILT